MKLRAFALPLILLYPLYGGVMYTKQQSILFPAASSEHRALQAALPENGQLVEIPTRFGRVRAVFLHAAVSGDGENPSSRPAILYLHGNFERIEDSFRVLQPLTKAGIPVLQLEYPGYGGADGEPSLADLTEATDAAYDWLARQPEVDPQRIIAMGYSIGGGIAAELTRRRPVRALILLSTYTSMQDIAHRYLLPGFLVRYPYDTLARIGEFTGPVFIEHGCHDEVIPFAMGQRLVIAAGSRGLFVPLDCGHADCHFDQSIFSERIPAWLASQRLIDH